MWDPYLFLQLLKLVTSNMVYNFMGLVSNLQKQLLGPKLTGVWDRDIQKIGTPIYFCNHWTTLNLVYELGLGCNLPKKNF